MQQDEEVCHQCSIKDLFSHHKTMQNSNFSLKQLPQILHVLFVKELQIDFSCETIITDTLDAKFTFMEGSKSLQQTQN